MQPARPKPGALLRLKRRDRFGQIEPLAGQLVTLVQIHPLDEGLADAVGYVHASPVLLKLAGEKPVQEFNIEEELENAGITERPCPKCGAPSYGTRFFPDGALLFRHGDTGHVLEAEELKP